MQILFDIHLTCFCNVPEQLASSHYLLQFCRMKNSPFLTSNMPYKHMW